MISSTATPVAGPSLRSIGSSIEINNEDQDRQHSSRQNLKEPNIKTSASLEHVLPQDPAINSDGHPPFQPTWRFYAIMISLSTMALCGTVEGTIIINALPTIVAALGGGSAFLWVPNAFLLASAASLPLYAQMSDIFGRRHMLLGAVGLFVLGSGLCGAASSLGMLIAARAIQGLGSGGIEMLTETVVTDLVPLRERSKYLSIVMVGGLVGAGIGPFLGGVIVVNLGWRWIFYLNVILGGAALIPIFVFLKVKHRRNQTLMSKLRRIDLGGNAIFIGSVVAVLLALTWAGPVYQWDSYRILLPLIIGFMGLIAFTAFEWTPKLAPEPSFPRALLSNRTSAAALFQAFICATIMYWTFYFLPVFFQGIQGKSPLHSGIALVPLSACVVPFAVIAGGLLSKYGRYKPIHAVAWAFLTTGLGLCSLLSLGSSTAAWVCFEIVCSSGLGMLAVTTLPAIQASLEEKYVATSTGMWCFVRGFGAIWGVTIPSVIFNNEARRYASLISDTAIMQRFADGQAYELATKAFLDTVTDPAVQDQVISVFARSIKVVWYVAIGFAIVGFLTVFVEKEVKLRQENNTEFGLEDEGAPHRAADEIPLEDLSSARRSR